MNSFGMLDFALPFGVLAVAPVGWMAVSRLSRLSRSEAWAREAAAVEQVRASGAKTDRAS